MALFNYTVYDSSGKTVKGVLTADTQEEARKVLRGQGFHIKNVTLGRTRTLLPSFHFAARNELTTISRQLSTLLSSGTNLSQALNVVMQQIEDAGLRAAFLEIHDTINRGVSFGDALEEFPHYFSPLYVNMVKAGESSGTLGLVLGRLALYLQKRKKASGGLTAAMAYPAIVMLIGIVVVAVLMTVVVPRLVKVVLMSSKDNVLPLSTRVLIGASDFFRHYWYIVFIIAVILFLLGYRIFKSERGRYFIDKSLLRIPVFGALLMKTAIARFATTFSTLLRSGIAPLDGLLIVQQILNNKYLEKAIIAVRRGVVDGNDMSTELEKLAVFPPIVAHMVSVGEETGQLEDLLQDIAEAYDSEVELATEKFIAVLEPLMIVIMAIVIGFVVFAIVMPIVEIGNIK